MTDWHHDLDKALSSGDPAYMKATLARVPKPVLLQALPELHRLAKASEKGGRLDDALSTYEALIDAVPERTDLHADRDRVRLALGRLQAAAAEARQLAPPPAAASQAPPRPAFDPALFDDPALPASFDAFRVDGLRQHLWRYSGQLSPANAIARLEDPAWLAAWDAALAPMAGRALVFCGSELGVLALRALHHGASHVRCVERFALDARITSGMVHKHFLGPWHARHEAEIPGWSQAQREASFEAFASRVEVETLGDGEGDGDGDGDGTEPATGAGVVPAADGLVLTQIDHTLLGTGIVAAIRRHLRAETGRPQQVLPARARVFAMAIRWAYPGTAVDLGLLRQLRWSPYPQALELGPEFWVALTEPVCVGEIDFERFAETSWQAELPVTAAGTVDAILSWFELDLGNTRISTAPGSALRCIKPAVHYTDPLEAQPGSVLALSVRVQATRLSFRTQPPATRKRGAMLASWYPPMLGDRGRHLAYQAALERTLVERPAELVLAIGAGLGLLAMTAAQAGAQRVVGCEPVASVAALGRELIARHPLAERVALVTKDCRHLTLPGDLPQRADLALLEMFDCSLIGEGVLHFLAHAREHLLTPQARFVPARAKLRGMIVEYRLDRLLDVDANLLNPYRAPPSFTQVDASTLAYRALTDPFDVFGFDFAQDGPAPQEQLLGVPAIAAGVAGAVMFWFDLGFDGHAWISNAPGEGAALHWKQGLQVLPEVRVEAGQALPIIARHDGSSLKFQWQPEGLPRDDFSRMPRWDPRWLAASSELEQATQRLLQHCTQHPDECAKVAEIAQRFAVDPAAHGLDPAIAQRFASMFLRGTPPPG